MPRGRDKSWDALAQRLIITRSKSRAPETVKNSNSMNSDDNRISQEVNSSDESRSAEGEWN